MIGLGTVINTAAIVAGGVLGLAFGRFLKPQAQEALTKVCGLSTLCIALSGILEQMAVLENSALLIIGCLALGTLVGELLNIEGGFERFGAWLKVKTHNTRDGGFVSAFVTASLTVCIGAMAIVGSIQDGISGDWSILATKAVLDLIIILVMTASLGKGAMFSAIPVAILQGSVTLLAGLLKGALNESALANLDLVGNVLILGVGINLLFGNKLRVANMLPAILAAMVLGLFAG